MAIQFLLDLLTGNMALVNVPNKSAPIKPKQGNPMGLLLTLTYSADQ
jgi:hypothetical protein